MIKEQDEYSTTLNPVTRAPFSYRASSSSTEGSYRTPVPIQTETPTPRLLVKNTR